jgi:lysophospholipase L1-like esterase
MKRLLVPAVTLTTNALLFSSLYACSSATAKSDDAPVPAPGADASSEPPVTDAAVPVAERKADAASAADAAPPVPPEPPGVRLVGRFDTTPSDGPRVGFPGARIIARFSGTEVKATFSDAYVTQDFGPNRWEVILDGAITKFLTLTRGPSTFTLATGLPEAVHTVELVKITDASVGNSQLMGFDFSGGTLLSPPAAKTRHIEFLGDSASNGYGDEGDGPICPGPFTGSTFSAATENEDKAYPALVANDLAADHQNLSVSGKGLYQNNYRTDKEVYSVVYPRTLPYDGGSAWSFADYVPDVVWMTLGGNDYDQPDGAATPPPFDAFQQKYDEMVALVRSKHPNAYVFCAVAPSLKDDYPVGFNAYTNVKTAAQNVVSKYNGKGDSKIYYFEFTRSTDADLTACDGHPNPAKHRAMADEAIAAIKAKTKWQ